MTPLSTWYHESFSFNQNDQNPKPMIEILRDMIETHGCKTDAISTISSTCLSLSPLQLMVEKLSGKKFCEWAQSIRLVLDRSGKLDYLTSATPKCTPINTAYL